MKNILLVLLLVASIVPSLAQNIGHAFTTASAQAAKDPAIAQMDQQIDQLTSQLDTLTAKTKEADLKRQIVDEMIFGYAGQTWSGIGSVDAPQQVKDLYTDEATLDPAAVASLTKQIADAKAARTQALWTKIVQIDPSLQPVIDQLRAITARAAANPNQ
jgi:hypothetical protein